MSETEGADVSPEPEVEELEADAELSEAEDQENEADSPPADEENVEEKSEDDPFEQRANKLTWQRREAERERDAERRRRVELEAEVNELRQAKPAEPLKTLQDFNYDEGQYQTYLFAESEKRAEAAAERIVKGFDKERRDTEARTRFESRESEFAKSVEDYEQKVYDENTRISPLMADEIRDSEVGPEMAYYLANNPEEAFEIFKLTDRTAVRRMAALEDRLLSEKKSSRGKSVSNAPPPPARTVQGSQPGIKIPATSTSSDKLSDREWLKRRELELAKRQ
jgi:hypothetical protein